MFGYVKIHKPELKIREYEQYKAVYCTLCKKLGKCYGHTVRMTLSYDFAFLAMLLLNAHKIKPCFSKGKCVYNPFKKCTYVDCNDNVDSVYDFVSAASVIMLYYKFVDDIRDKSFIKSIPSRILRVVFKKKYKKASLTYSEIDEIIREMDKTQIDAELNGSSIDAFAEPSADALGKICALSVDKDLKRIMYRIGYCVGKWVYLADAFDDLEDDEKQGDFNAIIGLDKDTVESNLNVCSNEAGIAFDLLDEGLFTNTIRNIFYLGMPTEIKRISNLKENKHERSI